MPRLRDIKRAVEGLGYELVPPRGGGSHYRVRVQGRVYTLPAHNGLRTDISEIYVAGLCRVLKMSVEDFKALL